jgi:hypothetical protein
MLNNSPVPQKQTREDRHGLGAESALAIFKTDGDCRISVMFNGRQLPAWRQSNQAALSPHAEPDQKVQ